MPAKKNDAVSRIEDKLDLFKDHFDDHMRVVGGKLEKMDERLDRVDVTAAKQQTVLEEHVRRSNLLETKIDREKAALEEKIEPLQNQSAQIKLFMKIAAWILGGGVAVGGAGMGIKELISMIFG